MKHIRLNSFFAFFLSFTLLISPLPITAMLENNVQELHKEQTTQESYIHLTNEKYNIADFISTVSSLDADNESPVHALKKYISNGFLIALKEEVLQVLGYAEWLLEQETTDIETSQRNTLLLTIDDLVQAIVEDTITADFNALDQYRKLPLLVINKRLKVEGKSRFLHQLIVEGKARFHKPVRFYERVHFKDNVRIDGVASIEDA